MSIPEPIPLGEQIRRLWRLATECEDDMLRPEIDYTLHRRTEGDKLIILNESIKQKYFSRRDIKSFIALFCNYNPGLEREEIVTEEKLERIETFFKYLRLKKYFQELCRLYPCIDVEKVIKHEIFGLFSIVNGFRNTSGFKHIFVGEVYNHRPLGLHNWIRYYLGQESGEIIFQENKSLYVDNRFVSISYKLRDPFNTHLFVHAPINNFFVGTHPMLELCIIALVYLNNLERGDTGLNVRFFVEEKNYQIVSYDYTNKLRTAFPERIPEDEIKSYLPEIKALIAAAQEDLQNDTDIGRLRERRALKKHLLAKLRREIDTDEEHETMEIFDLEYIQGRRIL